MNTRTVVAVAEVVSRLRNQSATRREISVDELVSVLVLLESIASSREGLVDGTVPAVELERAEAADAILAPTSGAGLFRAIAPPSARDTALLCRGSVQESSLLLRRRLTDLEPETLAESRPIQADAARRFKDAMCGPLPPRDERLDAVVRVIEANAFNGAKAAAGILATEPEDDTLRADGEPDVRTLCRRTLEGLDDVHLPRAVPIVINAFRASYLNALGGEYGEAAFFAGPEVDAAKSQQVLLLSGFVATRLAGTRLREEASRSAIADHLRKSASFPFLGLLIFLASRSDSPDALVAQALNDRDEILGRFLATRGDGRRYIHDMSADDLTAFKEERLDRIFRRLQRRVAAYDFWLRLNDRYLQPPIRWLQVIVPALNQGLAQVDPTFQVPDEVGGMDGEALSYGVNRVLMPEGYLHYATFTHKIERRLRRILADRDGQDLISGQVAAVFGAELTP